MLFLGLNARKIRVFQRFLPPQNSRIFRRVKSGTEFRENDEIRSFWLFEI